MIQFESHVIYLSIPSEGLGPNDLVHFGSRFVGWFVILCCWHVPVLRWIQVANGSVARDGLYWLMLGALFLVCMCAQQSMEHWTLETFTFHFFVQIEHKYLLHMFNLYKIYINIPNVEVLFGGFC